MTDIDWEATKRAEKVERIVAHFRSVHSALPPRLPIDVWAAQVHFPFAAMVSAAGCKPASPTTKSMVLEELAA